MFTEELKRSIKYYRTDDPSSSLSKKFWDEMQPALMCCGAEGWKDWEDAGHLKAGHKVPASCCDPQKGLLSVLLLCRYCLNRLFRNLLK